MLSNNLITVAAIGVALIGVLFFVYAILPARRARTAAYYGARRDAGRVASRRLLTGLALLGIAIGVFVLHWVWPNLTVGNALESARSIAASFVPSATPTPSPIPSTTPRPRPSATRTTAPTASRTPAPTRSATPPPQPSASATLALTPLGPTAVFTATDVLSDVTALSGTATPAITAEATLTSSISIAVTTTPTRSLTPSGQAVTPTAALETQRLTLRAVGTGVDTNGLPAGEGTRFPPTVRAIFVFFEYRNVPPSAQVRHTWFHNGGSAFYRQDVLNRNGIGVASISWRPEGGFEPGLYEVRVLLGNVPQFVANFEVR